jgi:hypothetical protein
MARNLFPTSLDPALAQPLLDVAYGYGLLEQPVVASTLFGKARRAKTGRGVHRTIFG